MAADFKIVDFVRHSSRPFIFSASLPPASTASALAALRYLENHPELPEKLKSISDYARKAYERNNIAFYPGITPIVPIYTKDSEYTLRLATNLYNSGVYVNPVLPPATPENECLLRTSLMATVTEDLVDEAAIIIAKEIAKLDKHEQ